MVSFKTVLLRFPSAFSVATECWLFFISVVLIFWKETIYIGSKVILLLLVGPSLILVKLTISHCIILCNVFWNYLIFFLYNSVRMTIYKYLPELFYSVLLQRPIEISDRILFNGIAISRVRAHGAELFYFFMEQYLGIFKKKNFCINNMTRR